MCVGLSADRGQVGGPSASFTLVHECDPTMSWVWLVPGAAAPAILKRVLLASQVAACAMPLVTSLHPMWPRGNGSDQRMESAARECLNNAWIQFLYLSQYVSEFQSFLPILYSHQLVAVVVRDV